MTDRMNHAQFLEEELAAETESFKDKMHTAAQYLLQNGEMYIGKYLNFDGSGNMVLKISPNRSLPRKREYLYCFMVPKELRNHNNWGSMTYSDLLKVRGISTQAVCVWQQKNKDGFFHVGFRSVDEDFHKAVTDSSDFILLLGPDVPPFQYIVNLQDIVKNNFSAEAQSVLDQNFKLPVQTPILLDHVKNIPNFILSQIGQCDALILQGPPGTGKTFQIAQMCIDLCREGKRILVTALTNRALMELAEKVYDKTKELKIYKTNLTADESKELPELLYAKDPYLSECNNLMLSTFYMASNVMGISKPIFDFVIMDEASQAFLAMFAAAKILGKKNIWVGDIKQLSPIVQINADNVIKRNYSPYINGLETVASFPDIPTYQMTETYRLVPRSAEYTGLFYRNTLEPKTMMSSDSTMLCNDGISRFFNKQGGPSLIKMHLEPGNKKPDNAICLTAQLVDWLLRNAGNMEIAVLSYFVETTKALQKEIYATPQSPKNLLVETVSRVQGLTTDVVIFVVPNTRYSYSLNPKLFNVATSRARRYTLIVADDQICGQSNSPEVNQYLSKLNNEFSFEV